MLSLSQQTVLSVMAAIMWILAVKQTENDHQGAQCTVFNLRNHHATENKRNKAECLFH